MNPLAPSADNGEVVGRYMNDALVERNPDAVDRPIVRVLRQAHRIGRRDKA
jgi:hypothetical protein